MPQAKTPKTKAAHKGEDYGWRERGEPKPISKLKGRGLGSFAEDEPDWHAANINEAYLLERLGKHGRVFTAEDRAELSEKARAAAGEAFQRRHGQPFTPEGLQRLLGASTAAWRDQARAVIELRLAERDRAEDPDDYLTNPDAAAQLAETDEEREIVKWLRRDRDLHYDFTVAWNSAFRDLLRDQNVHSLPAQTTIPLGRQRLYQIAPETPQEVLDALRLRPVEAPNAPLSDVDLDMLRLLSMQPAQTVDRAARGSQGWLFPEDGAPRYLDSTNAHYVEYKIEGQEIAELQSAVQRLNPRTADVWRILTAASLEAWQDGQLEPPAVWFDVRELAKVMGYTKHVNGGYRPRDLEEVARAIQNLDAFHITIPLGSMIIEQPDPKTGKRKRGKATALRHYKVLFKAATDELRDMFGNTYPLRWQLKPGEWIKGYPKIYAPLFRAIVALPGKAGPPSWAKALGTELSYQYRQDRDRSPLKTLTVRRLLERACLLEEATESPKKGRMRQYFEDALDLLQDIGVCESWQYRAEDIDRVDAKKKSWYEDWLEARVVITAPYDLVASLPQLSGSKKA